MKKHALNNQGYIGRAKNNSLVRLEQGIKSIAPIPGYGDPSADDKQDDICCDDTDHGERENEVEKIFRPPVETPVINPPFIDPWAPEPQRGSRGPPATDPLLVRDGGSVGNAYSGGYKTRKRFRTPPNPPDKVLLTDEEAAYVLDLEPESLAVFRSTGRHGIPYIKIGRNVRYRRSDLEAWLTSRTHLSNSTIKVKL